MKPWQINSFFHFKFCKSAPRDFCFSLSLGASESWDSMVFISLIQSLYKTSLWTSAEKLRGSTYPPPSSVRLLSASLIHAQCPTHKRLDGADLIKFADGGSDDYCAGKEGAGGRGAKEDNENNSRGAECTDSPSFPPPLCGWSSSHHH